MKRNFFLSEFLLLILLILASHATFSQSDSLPNYKNIVFGEAGGAGGFGSVNYERQFLEKKNFKMSARGGLGMYHITDFEMKFNPDLLIPMSLYAYYGKTHHIDLGVGQTISNMVYMDFDKMKKRRHFHFHTNLSIGYRYQKPTSRLFLKVAYTPLIEFNENYIHWGAFSFGYVF